MSGYRDAGNDSPQVAPPTGAPAMTVPMELCSLPAAQQLSHIVPGLLKPTTDVCKLSVQATTRRRLHRQQALRP